MLPLIVQHYCYTAVTLVAYLCVFCKFKLLIQLMFEAEVEFLTVAEDFLYSCFVARLCLV